MTTFHGPILVTGAAGFVGANLCRRLASCGADVHAITGPTRDAWRLDGEPRIIRYAADVQDLAALQAVVARVRPDVIYHLATHGAYPFQNDLEEILRTNVLGLSNLLQAAEKVDYSLLVHAGSSSEYGRKREAMREDDALEPDSFYAVAKASQSLLAQHWARSHGRPIVVLRLFSVYGPYEEPTRLIPRLIQTMIEDTPLAMVAPDTARDFIHVDDVVAAFLAVDALKAAAGEIVNLGTGVQTRLEDVIATAERIAGRRLPVTWGAMPPRIWDSTTWRADVSKLQRLLGPMRLMTFEQGLARALEWSRAGAEA